MNQVPILTTEQEVADLARRLLQQESVAIDLEMDSMHSYQEKICLAQVSTLGETVIIDPLAGGDLAPLAPVFAAESIRKIFHAVDYDMRSLKRDYGFVVKNLFDTMIAAQFCGEEKIGLADLLQKYFKIELDKKYQRADWSQRPLKNEMIEYAAEDTRHLHRLVEILEEKLQGLGRTSWLVEECKLLEEVAFDTNGGPLFLRFKGAGRLERSQLAILEELLQWRDREAERRNRPHFKILGNKPLLAMAQATPVTRKELFVVEGINERLVDRYGKQLLAAVEKAVALPEKSWPHFPRAARTKRDPQAEKIFDRLKKWRLVKAEELKLDPGVLINNAQLEAISRGRPTRPEELSGNRGLRRWQVAELGDDIIAEIRKQ
jgi:ribonuclease D